MWEIPLATAPATLYLGQALFEERPSAGRIAGNFVRSLPQLIWYQVVLRVMVLFPPAWLWLFAQRPYLNEVILLERTPLAQKTPANPSTGRRCRTLHAGRGGDLFGRWMAAVTVGAMLAASCWGSMWLGGGLLLNEWEPTNAWFTHGFHLALWLVVGSVHRRSLPRLSRPANPSRGVGSRAVDAGGRGAIEPGDRLGNRDNVGESSCGSNISASSPPRQARRRFVRPSGRGSPISRHRCIEAAVRPDSPVTGPVRRCPTSRTAGQRARGTQGMRVLLEPFDAGPRIVGFYQAADGAVVEFIQAKDA